MPLFAERSKLKGGSFLVSETDPMSVFISQEWNEEQQMILQMVKDFCMQEIQEPMLKSGKELDAATDQDKIVALLEKAADLGLCGIGIEEEYGGIDLDFNTGLLFSEAIALGFSFATTIGAQTSIGSLPIVYYGTEEQKARYLPGIASAKLKAAYCLTEPSAGSDANSGKASAVLNEAGTHYMLNGQKMWITNGGFADLFIVFAKIDNDKKLSAFIVEKEFGGITLGVEERKLGIKGSSTVQVFFDNCPVPVDNLLSHRGDGFKIALNILNTGRIKLGASTNGGCKFGLTKGIQYAIERKQFDKPIAEFGAMKYKIGEMASRTYCIDAGIYRTGHLIDQKTRELQDGGMKASKAKLEAVREFAIECSILKIKGSENADYCIDEVLQIHGGMGYAVETGIEMGYRDARITRIYEGTNEINRLLSVAELTKRALKTKEIDLMTAGKKIPTSVLKNLSPFQKKKDLLLEKRLVNGIKQAFLLISGSAGKKLREKLVDEQEIVMNMADILAEAFICESAILKVEKLRKLKLEDKKRRKIQKKMVQLYLYEALDRARKAGKDAIASYASGLEKTGLNRLLNNLLPEYDINPKRHRRAIADYVIEKKGFDF